MTRQPTGRHRLGRHRRPICAPRPQGPAALHHLRQRGRRQEHPHRAPAVRHPTHRRGPAGRARRRQRRFGTQNGALDFALLVDGLAAEREQGITIDVAYRFFSTDRRKFIVADCPATSSTRATWPPARARPLACDPGGCAQGLLTQTRRMQLPSSPCWASATCAGGQQDGPGGLQPGRFTEIEAATATFRRASWALPGDGHFRCPACAATTSPRARARPGTTAPPLMEHLEPCHCRQRAQGPFRLPVQWVNRPDQNFRGFAGTLAGAACAWARRWWCCLRRGARAWRVRSDRGDVDSAVAGEAVTSPSPTRSTSAAATCWLRPPRHLR